MARDNITVVFPVEDATKSLASNTITATTISTSNGGTIVGATGCKDNSLTIIVDASTAGTVTFVAGVYDNACLGNDSVACSSGLNVIKIENPSRFQKADGNIDVNFTTVAGKIFAVGKRAGLKPTA